MAGVSILATCKTIHTEASKPLGHKLDVLLKEPLSIITNTEFMNKHYLVSILQGVQGSSRFKEWHNVKDEQIAHFVQAAGHCKRNQKFKIPEVHIALRVPSNASKPVGEFYELKTRVFGCIRFHSFLPPRANLAMDVRTRYALAENSEDGMPTEIIWADTGSFYGHRYRCRTLRMVSFGRRSEVRAGQREKFSLGREIRFQYVFPAACTRFRLNLRFATR